MIQESAALIIKMISSLHFALFIGIWGFQQLLERSSPHYFSSSDPPLTFSSTSEQLCASLYVNTYALIAWVFFSVLPSAPQEILSIQTAPGYSKMQTIHNIDGSLSINIETCRNSYVLQMAGLPTNVWLHVGMSLGSQQALASVITWAGVQIVQSQPLSFAFPLLKAAFSGITLGGSSPVADKVEIVDARYYTYELTAVDMMTAANSRTCFIESARVVTTLAILFDQIVARNTVLTLNEDVNEYSFSNSRVDTSYSATQWLWFTETDNTGHRAIFRLTQSSNNIGTPGDRVMCIFLRKFSPHTLLLRFDTSTNTNKFSPYLVLPVSAM